MYLSFEALALLLTNTQSYLPTKFYTTGHDDPAFEQELCSFDASPAMNKQVLGRVASDAETPEALVKRLMLEHSIVLGRRYYSPTEFEMVMVWSGHIRKFDQLCGLVSVLFTSPEEELVFFKRHNSPITDREFFQAGGGNFLPPEEKLRLRRHSDSRVEFLSFHLDGVRLQYKIAPVLYNGLLNWRVVPSATHTDTIYKSVGITCLTAPDAWNVISALHRDEVEQREMRKKIAAELFGDDSEEAKSLAKTPKPSQADLDEEDEDDDVDYTNAKKGAKPSRAEMRKLDRDIDRELDR